MNAILTIAALVAAVTAHEIVQAIVAHVKAKNAIKLLKAKREAAEAQRAAEEARKSAAEIEKISQATKAELASRLSTLTEEQLAAYNRTLEEARQPVMQYVHVPHFYPYNYGMQAWRGW